MKRSLPRRPARLPLLAGFLLVALPLVGCGGDVPEAPVTETLETVSDQIVLDQLTHAGSDLTRSTDIRWYVYLPSTRAAEAFDALAREGGWEVECRPAAGGPYPLCLCARRAVPTLDGIRAMRADLRALAQGLDADVDGWEAAVRK